MNNIRILITGANGFVGNFVSHFLAAKGFSVVATTRTNFNDNTKCTPNLNWIVSDLIGRLDYLGDFDAILHFASENPAYLTDPIKLYRNNFQTAKNIFSYAKYLNVKTVVFLSSMSIYGNIFDDLVNENTKSINPNTYGQSKLDSENFLKNEINNGLNSGLSIRLPGVVGKNSRNNFLSNILINILNEELVKVYNPDSLFNNVVHVKELAEFIYSWILLPKVGYHVTNLCSIEPVKIKDVIALIYELTEKTVRIEFSEFGKKSFLIDADKALKLGFRPATVDQSIRNFILDNLYLK